MTELDEIFLVDSNILIYAYEKEESHKKKISEEILNKCFAREINLAVTNQNLGEFSYVSTRKGKLNPEDLKKIINDIIISFNFIKINYTENTVTKTLNIIKDYPEIHFWDALIIATMKENNISSIYTENIKDFKIEGITAVNPFD